MKVQRLGVEEFCAQVLDELGDLPEPLVRRLKEIARDRPPDQARRLREAFEQAAKDE